MTNKFPARLRRSPWKFLAAAWPSAAAFAAVLLASGCDPSHKRKCEWYLMPEPSLAGKSSEGHIPVCARNLVINREYCRIEATMDLAKSVYGKKFRFVDMTIDKEGKFPKKVTAIDFTECQ